MLCNKCENEMMLNTVQDGVEVYSCINPNCIDCDKKMTIATRKESQIIKELPTDRVTEQV